MKTDWFNVLSEIRNIPIDENLAYELEVFFKDFVLFILFFMIFLIFFFVL